jgi:hypothetical protein
MRARVTNVVLLLLCLAGLARAQAPDEIKIKGKDEYKLAADGAAYKLHGPGEARRKLRKDGEAWTLVGDDGKPTLRARRSADGGVKITDGKGAPVHELRPQAEGWTLVGPDGALAWRVKVKADKVNVYDGTGARRYHLKAKEDGISIHDESAQVWKLKGLATPADAAPFALPIDMGEAALLWVARR